MSKMPTWIVSVARRLDWFTHRVAPVPGGHHNLTLFQQQEMSAALPATVDFLNERGQVLQALPPPFL